MPVFIRHSRAVLYMHVPKTGGTAIGEFFRKNGFRTDFVDVGGPDSLNRYRRCAPQHMHAAQVTAVLRPAAFDFVFMTVREPLARVLSEYRMRIRTTTDAPPLEAWWDQMVRAYAEDSHVAENHFRPQVEFLLPHCDVFRQEDGFGAAFVERIEQRLGLRLEHRQVGVFNFDDETLIAAGEVARIERRVRQFYRQDYLTFGYEH